MQREVGPGNGRSSSAGSRSFTTYLVFGATAVLGPILVACSLAFILLANDSTRFRGEAAETELETRETSELLRDLATFDRAAEVALSRGAGLTPDLRRMLEEVDSGLAVAMGFDDEEERDAAEQASRQLASARLILSESEGGAGDSGPRDSYESAIGGAEALVLELIRLGGAEQRDALAAIEAERRHDEIPLYVALALALILTGTAIRMFSSRVGRPLRRLREGAERLQQGHLTHRVVPDGPNETRSLALAFNGMADSVQEGRRTLEARALSDPLTGLANRQSLEDRFRAATSAAGPGLGPSLLFIDLDDFKRINDSRGHAFGDDVLRHVGARLESTFHDGVTVGRVGGDELAVLVEWSEGSSPGADSAAIAERILRIVAAPYAISGTEIILSCSIGIAHTEPGADFDELLRDADLAMYSGRERKSGGYAYFRPALHEANLDRLDRMEALRSAIENEGLALHYQPLVYLGRDGIAGVEALVRWPGPDGGLVSPADFIPLAEETGLIVPLGRWVLREACRQTVAWDSQGGVPADLVVGVNLSARQLHDSNLISDVEAALRDSGLPPERLTFEITETAIMTDVEIAIATLHELRRLGVWLAIDDFGTGQSSLSYLRRFPVSHLKVAREFVDQVEVSPNDLALVKGVVDLAHGLGHKVIAEGIERREQSEILATLGCDIAQGFHYSRPVPAAELEAAIKDLEAPRGDSVPSANGSSSQALPLELSTAPAWKSGSDALLALGHSQIARLLPDIAILLFDRDMRYLAVEGPALERAGWRREELEGKTIDETMPPERADALRLILGAVLAGSERSFELRSSRSDAHFEAEAEPVRNGAGAIIGVIVVARDAPAGRSLQPNEIPATLAPVAS